MISNFKSVKVFKFVVMLVVMLLPVAVITGCSSGKGGEKDKNIPVHMHEYSELIKQVDPTCENEGIKAHYICKSCGEIFDNDRDLIKEEDLILGALGHSFTTYVDDGNATCDVDGTKTAKCDRCSLTDTVIVEGTKLGHSYVNGKCARCSDEIASVTVNGVEYATLVDAVNSIETTEEVEIVLQSDMVGDGIKIDNKNIVFDFNGHVYTLNSNTVGSTGTETNGFQMLKGSKVTFKNGVLNNSTEKGAKIMLQNYCDLTLDNFTVDVSMSENGYGTYAVSNNNGSLTVKNGSNIIAKQGNVAFDLWYGMNNTGLYDDGIVVTIEETAGVIDGKIEYGAASHGATIENWQEKAKLTINGGTFKNHSIVNGGNCPDMSKANITIAETVKIEE